MNANELEAAHDLLGERVIELIEKIHGVMRPFVLILPASGEDENQITHCLTNVMSVPVLREILKEHIKTLRGKEELERTMVTIQ